MKLEGHKSFIQPEIKKRNRSEEDDSDGFFDTECREEDDEPVEETLTDLLFYDLECRTRKRSARTELVCRSERNRRGMDISRRYNAKGLLRMAVYARKRWMYRHGPQLPRIRQLFCSSVFARARRYVRCDYAWRQNPA